MTRFELDRYRLKNRLSVRELAERLGYSHNLVWKVLRGWMPMSKRMELKLQILGIEKVRK